MCYKYAAALTYWGYSSVGRASRSHREGQGFESPYLHLTSLIEFSVSTPTRETLVDITERIQAALTSLGDDFTGMVYVFVPHTTAGITINEGADPSVARDLVDALARIVPRQAGYRHAEGNSDAHVKASLIGSHVAVPVQDGRLRLGTWQSIYLAEFDGPRTRRVWVMPISAGDRVRL